MAGKRGAPAGNDNAIKNKPWAEALRKALVQYEAKGIKRGEAMAKIAQQVVTDALGGSKDAWQEIGNRMDGKPHQTLSAEVDAVVNVSVKQY